MAEFATVEDRERIARDLHDTVIQRLFAIGLSLQASARLITDEKALSRVVTAIDELDTTVREVRAAIFELHSARLPGRSVRQELLDLCTEAARGLGFDPVVRFDGPIDTAVDGSLADDLFAVARETLSNVARHAAATTVEVGADVRDGTLTIRVSDDGRGIDPGRSSGGRGVTNLATRAAKAGGSFTVTPRDSGGTDVVWSAPIRPR